MNGTWKVLTNSDESRGTQPAVGTSWRPVVSLVVPSFRMGATLAATLDSILCQTYDRIELIVQDNGSTDETVSVLRAYADRIDILAVELDRGQSHALAMGFRRSRGEVLGWLNADDMLMPDAVERALEAFQRPSSPAVVYGDCAFITANDQFIRYFHEIDAFSEERLRNDTDFIAQPSTFFTRAAYEQIGGIDENLAFAMDWDLWCRFAAAGFGFERIGHVLSAARFHPETKTSGGGFTRWLELLRVNRRHATRRIPRAALAHFYADFLRPHMGRLRPLARTGARALFGPDFLDSAIVEGLNTAGVAQPSGFRLIFPLHRVVCGAHLVFDRIPAASDGGNRARREPEVRLAGMRVATKIVGDNGGRERFRADWRADPPRVWQTVDLAVHIPGQATDPLELVDFQLDLAPPDLGG